jgi:predicted nucleic acid-binding protein
LILVDTDVLIAHLRGFEPARDWLEATRRESGRLGASVVTVSEILGGMRSPERSAVAQLLSSLRLLTVTEVIARRAGELMRRYRRSHVSVGLGDYLIAATAEVQGLELATLNVKHFPMFEGLQPPFILP